MVRTAMIRTRKRQWLAAGIALLLGVQVAVAINATAQDPKTQALPTTTWTISPNSLSGLGAYFAAAHVPSPVAGQSENKWQHGLVFRFTGAVAPFGIVSLDTDGEGKFASLALNDGAGGVQAERFPFNWTADKFYFPFVAMLPGSAVAAFVYDVTAQTFTYIGTERAQAAWGNISGSATTIVRWYGGDQEDCAEYPRTDVFWSLPFGFVPGDPVPHPGASPVNIVVPGDCPATVANEPDAATFRHYVAGSVAGPTTTTSTTTTTTIPTTTTTTEGTTTTTEGTTTTTEATTTTTEATTTTTTEPTTTTTSTTLAP